MPDPQVNLGLIAGFWPSLGLDLPTFLILDYFTVSYIIGKLGLIVTFTIKFRD